MENRALGKGLSALIPEKPERIETVTHLRVNMIQDNKLQPRTNYDDLKLADLKASIKEKGVLQPILIRKRQDGYEVIAGERRLRAARALGMEEVPVIIKEVNDQEALVIALVENIQREELNPVEEARAYKKLIEEFQYTHDSVAQSVGKDRSTVTNMLRLLKLPDEIIQSVYDGNLSMGHARAILSVESPTEKKRLFDITIRKGISVRELENLAKVQIGGGARREKGQNARSPELIALEEELQKRLGTKVRVTSKKKRGKIVIEFYSADDLDRILQLIRI